MREDVREGGKKIRRRDEISEGVRERPSEGGREEVRET